MYVDLAPQAWAKAKAYGRAAIENTGEILQATGQAMTTKAAQIDAKPVSKSRQQSLHDKCQRQSNPKSEVHGQDDKVQSSQQNKMTML